ncbi:MAG: 2-amino-4-hydroxy-6-hydroxymethyldihydropteridine diphosphokinase [Alphaproteobacteria bacterium]|nr:2-amino-4-hydroxy-6-hydroxymethyldihydropteridine diphosphokinase [Alphaproteobacteria bacterium]
MIVVGIGGNLESVRYGSPRDTLSAALAALTADGIKIPRRSGWYRSEPVPRSDQPWFVNAVALLATELDADKLLDVFQGMESRFGRIRGEPNAARVLDLDLLDYDGEVRNTKRLVLPHPRLHERLFVLVPLAEIAPAWRHPLSGLTASQLLARLATQQQRIERLSC